MQGGAGGGPPAAASPPAASEVEVLAALCGNRKGRRKAAAPAPAPEARFLTMRSGTTRVAHACSSPVQFPKAVFRLSLLRVVAASCREARTSSPAGSILSTEDTEFQAGTGTLNINSLCCTQRDLDLLQCVECAYLPPWLADMFSVQRRRPSRPCCSAPLTSRRWVPPLRPGAAVGMTTSAPRSIRHRSSGHRPRPQRYSSAP